MKLLSRSQDETEEIGRRLGLMLRAGMTVKLYGELGSGKTTMVKGIAAVFGIDSSDVVSPSFTIVTEYETVPRLFHMDLYRITGKNDLESTGIWECFSADSVCVIEWPEVADDFLPEGSIKVRLSHKAVDEREIVIEGISEEDWHNLQT